MAHNLEIIDGNASMFYVASEGVPWHGLGTEVPDALTSADAITAAHLDWSVSTEAIITESGLAIPDGRRCRAIIRDDTRTVLGVTGRRYKPIQNQTAFDFLDTLAGQRTLRYHTAGVLGRGECVWILGQLAGTIRVGKTDDTILKFLLFSNRHDGTATATARMTPIRVVCENTLSQAMRGGKDGVVSIRHTGVLENKVAEAQRILGLAVVAYDDLGAMINAAAGRQLNKTQLKAYFNTLYGPGRKRTDEDGDDSGDSGDGSKVHGKTQKVLDRLEELFTSSPGNDMPGIKGTAWAAYNAVTYYVDYERPSRVEKDRADRKESVRLDSIMFGDGAKTKIAAWDEMMAMVN